MLKYQNLLNHLTIEEKVKLITSDERIKNKQIKDYEFPSIDFVDSLKDIVNDFIMPSYNSLGSVYDTNLIKEFGEKLGNYLASINYNKIINIPISPISDNNPNAFSSSRLVSARLGSNFANGIENGGHFASYGVLPGLSGINLDSYFNDDLYSYKVAFSAYKPYASILSSSDAIDTLNGDYDFRGLKIVLAKNELDLKTAINHKSSLSILDNKNNVELIIEAVNNYNKLKNQLAKGEISNEALTSAISRGDAINPYTIDEILDFLLDKLAHFEELTKKPASFNFKELEEIEYRISQSSVILLKNDNDILPIKRENKISFIGDQLFNPKFNTDKNVNINVLNIIDSYHLETVGVGHGYVKGQE